ncbi:hypothetical protein QF043_005772 [Pseudomonas sp. W3I7]|nr:hypothetical protein [Pseudomonas sp. W3I7]
MMGKANGPAALLAIQVRCYETDFALLIDDVQRYVTSPFVVAALPLKRKQKWYQLARSFFVRIQPSTCQALWG